MLRRVFLAGWGVLLLSTVCAAKLPVALCPTLATDIKVTHQAEFAAAVAAGNDQAIADAYNLRFSPDYWVWKSALPERAIYEETSPDGTTWKWSTYQAQNVAERDSWSTAFRAGLASVNPSLPQTRIMLIGQPGSNNGQDSIFQGTNQITVDQRTHLKAMMRRLALRGEQLFHLTGAGFGTGTAADPATMGFEGKITGDDIACALRPTP